MYLNNQGGEHATKMGKELRRIYATMNGNGVLRVRKNEELKYLCKNFEY